MTNPIERNHVQTFGSQGCPIVFGHGLGSDQRAWRLVAPAFQEHWRCVLFDHVGCGNSDLAAYSATRHNTLQGYALDLLEVLQALDLPPVVYVGHSVGGIIGLLASLADPTRFAGLVLVGSSPCFLNDGPYRGGFEPEQIEGLLDLLERDQPAWAATLAPMAFPTEAAPDMVSDLGRGLRQMDALVARRFARLAFLTDCRPQLTRVRTPALMLHCADDRIAPRETALYMADHIAGSRRVEIAASGHCPHLSHPADTLAALRAFLGHPSADRCSPTPTPFPLRS